MFILQIALGIILAVLILLVLYVCFVRFAGWFEYRTPRISPWYETWWGASLLMLFGLITFSFVINAFSFIGIFR